MKKFLVGILVLTLVFGFSSFSYAAKAKVGIVYDVGGRGDKSFNDAAYKGLQDAVKKLDIEGKDVEPGEGGANREELLRLLAEQGYDLVIGVGFLFTDALVKVAKDFPNTKFAIVDGVIEDLPNVRSLVFKEHEGSFLVGAIAGLMTKTNKVGFVGGMDMSLIHKFEVGYRAGVKYVNPKAEIFVNYIGVTGDAFKDPVKGKELALSQFKQGADIVYHASGASGEGVIEAAKEMKKFAIGVDSNQNWIAPGYVLTSMLKKVDVAVYKTIEDLVNGKFTGGVKVYGLRENGVGVAYDKYNEKLIPESVRRRVAQIRLDIIAGKIKVPETK
ncbi:MAG TPA: BMP family ABC transporter substrate-binding protein [bacterium]|jgi:basic membrane protein A|nr:BMP family ABC transporter substrate-binding protein [Dictyoglomota bacterium]HHV80344.1 BMP family ABC transporter substrate-binding protein [bacterium]HOK29992.1 BMP family ABC transporter substrate-binding protein [bacterium]HOL55188.1 BMP family ABC transporter substrate-binding protein [bacterium]HOP56148.1 BMP family ABC transporter substrate-binding protein [bacterium]